MLQHQRTEIVANVGLQTPARRAAARQPLQALEPFGQQVTIRRGKEIYSEGVTADHCYKIISGSVRLVKLMSDGHRQICEFLVAGDLFGFESEDARYFAAEAVNECVLVRYNRRNVDTLIGEDMAFARHMRHLSSKGLEAAYKRMVLLCHKTAHERIAWFLLELADRTANDNDCIQLPMTRGDIADYLGMVIETVSRTFTQLKESGVISMQSVNNIKLVDRDALEEARGDL